MESQTLVKHTPDVSGSTMCYFKPLYVMVSCKPVKDLLNSVKLGLPDLATIWFFLFVFD